MVSASGYHINLAQSSREGYRHNWWTCTVTIRVLYIASVECSHYHHKPILLLAPTSPFIVWTNLGLKSHSTTCFYEARNVVTGSCCPLRHPIRFSVFVGWTDPKIWSGWWDSNSRPTVPKTVALPDCATPGYFLRKDFFREIHCDWNRDYREPAESNHRLSHVVSFPYELSYTQ